jgi:hypothetical protein
MECESSKEWFGRKEVLMRMHVVAVCLLVGTILLAAEPSPDSVKKHREKVQGVWAAVELDGAGQNVPKDAKEFRLVFMEDTVIFDRAGEKEDYRFHLQSAVSRLRRVRMLRTACEFEPHHLLRRPVPRALNPRPPLQAK